MFIYNKKKIDFDFLLLLKKECAFLTAKLNWNDVYFCEFLDCWLEISWVMCWRLEFVLFVHLVALVDVSLLLREKEMRAAN